MAESIPCFPDVASSFPMHGVTDPGKAKTLHPCRISPASPALARVGPRWPLRRVPRGIFASPHRRGPLVLASAVGGAPSPSSSSSSSSSSPKQSSAAVLKGFVMGRGPEGSWDSGGVGRPVVRRLGNAESDTWLMWYEGWRDGPAAADGEKGEEGAAVAAAASCVGLALSANGLIWTRGLMAVETNSRGEGGAGLVLQPSSNWWSFDTRHVRAADIIMMSSPKVRASAGVFWMYYEGHSHEELELPGNFPSTPVGLLERSLGVRGAGPLRSRPGLAMSNDGRNWATIGGEHHSGALLDVGTDGEWDSLLIGSPHVVFHAPGDLRMYYHALDPNTWRFSIGLARSTDGLKWVKLGRILEADGGNLGYLNPQVLRNPGFASFPKDSYIMLYEQVTLQGHGSIHVALSEDGLSRWSKKSRILDPNTEGEGRAWDSVAVGSPCLVPLSQEEGILRLYYVGYGQGGFQGIGAAEAADGGLLFTRVEVPTNIV